MNMSRRTILALSSSLAFGGCQTLLGGKKRDDYVSCESQGKGWNRYQADIYNSGVVSSSLEIPPKTQPTIIKKANERQGGVVVDDSRNQIFVTDNNKVHAFTAGGETKQWTQTLDEVSYTPPSSHCEVVFCASLATLYALKKNDGEILWKKRGGPIRSPPVLVRDTLGVTPEGVVQGLNPKTGKQKWETDVHAYALAGDKNSFYACGFDRSNNGVVASLDVTDGAVSWKTTIEAQLKRPPTVVDDSLFIVDNSGEVYRIEKSSGKIKWRKPVVERRAPTPMGVDSQVIVVSGNGDICYSLDYETGSKNWEIETGPVLSPPIATKEHIIIGSMNQGIFFLDRQGNISQRFTKTRAGSPLALGEEGLYYKTAGLSTDIVRLPRS